MTLYFIGIGLNDEKDITLKGLETVKKCEYIYLEYYTSMLHCDIADLEDLYGKKIITADRDMVEKRADEIIDQAREEDVAFLVIGDIFGATTHTDLMLRAKEKDVHCAFIHNASIINGVGIVGLELYKYGRITSIPFQSPGFSPETHYTVLKENKTHGLHTLMLLDLRPHEDKFMTVNDAIKSLLELERKRKEQVFSEDTWCIGCARIGGDHKIKYATAKNLLAQDFGEPLHCLIIPGELHFVEEDAIAQWK